MLTLLTHMVGQAQHRLRPWVRRLLPAREI